jgi:hypothetical protein
MKYIAPISHGKNGKKISISLWIMDYKWLLQNYLVGFIVLSWNINDLCKRKWEINNLLSIPSGIIITGTCFIQNIYAPSSSLLQGKHLLFTPSPLRLKIFRLFVILSLTQFYRYTPEIFLFSTATYFRFALYFTLACGILKTGHVYQCHH